MNNSTSTPNSSKSDFEGHLIPLAAAIRFFLVLWTARCTVDVALWMVVRVGGGLCKAFDGACGQVMWLATLLCACTRHSTTQSHTVHAHHMTLSMQYNAPFTDLSLNAPVVGRIALCNLCQNVLALDL